MALSEFDKGNIDKILDDKSPHNWFTAQLFRLIFKADIENTEKLYQVYPDEVNAVYKYKNGIEYKQD